MENYFEVLELSIDEIQGQDEETIQSEVKAAHKRLYAFTIGSYTNILRLDGRTQAQWQVVLNDARDTLLDPQRRREHIAQLVPTSIPTPDSHGDPPPRQQDTRTIIKFRNGDEATSIPQLATLMEKNAREATDILYHGYLEQGLAGAGETPFAQAAKAVVNQFSTDRSLGMMAMISILSGKVKMHKGGEASNSKQLVSLIDNNWDEAKTLLYSGFFALWLEHTNQMQLSSTTKKIMTTFKDDEDIGLEELVQRLDPQIGRPEPEVSQSEIDFGNINSESQKTIQFKIKNVGRGFLYGDVQLASNMPGLQISNTEIQGDGVVTINLDARSLTAKQKHQASLVVDTNGGTVTVPVSCYITYPVQNSIQRLAISGFSLAAITLVTRLIIQQFGSSGWLATRLTGAGFTEWEQIWQWDRWFEWPWFEWPVYTLSAPKAGIEFVVALAALGVGIFAYWHFLFKKKGMP
ncbi:MAG: hypothetical protein OXM61_10825 [Candidatus Poribacteria bacterium]|nr:hypothetical protein [Candidatus Poribacteria bacterium]